MKTDAITGLSILVVEDMLSLGTALAHGLKQAGAQVIGPIATVKEALAALDLLPDRLPDIATLDVQLDRETSFPIADELTRLGIPFVFATGTAGIIPVAHRSRTVCAKPYTLNTVLTALNGALVGDRNLTPAAMPSARRQRSPATPPATRRRGRGRTGPARRPSLDR